MKINAASTTAVLALLFAGVLTSNAQRDYKDQSLDLLRLLASKPWASASYGRWEPRPPAMDSRTPFDEADDEFRSSSKRSAVATALNSGRRRRQPTPALGVLNDVGSFFDSLRDNLETLTSLTPLQRSTLFQGPSVVNAPSGDLTTADHSWRPMGTQTRTATTQGCCGPDWAARVAPTYPHPHARFHSRNTRDHTYNKDDETDSAVNAQSITLPSLLFPEYFIAYENVDNRKDAQDVFYNSLVPLDSELGQKLLLEYFKYRSPRRKDDIDIEKPVDDNDDSENEIVRMYRQGSCNHF